MASSERDFRRTRYAPGRLHLHDDDDLLHDGAFHGEGGEALVFEIAPATTFGFGKGVYSRTRWASSTGEPASGVTGRAVRRR